MQQTQSKNNGQDCKNRNPEPGPGRDAVSESRRECAACSQDSQKGNREDFDVITEPKPERIIRS